MLASYGSKSNHLWYNLAMNLHQKAEACREAVRVSCDKRNFEAERQAIDDLIQGGWFTVADTPTTKMQNKRFASQCRSGEHKRLSNPAAALNRLLSGLPIVN